MTQEKTSHLRQILAVPLCFANLQEMSTVTHYHFMKGVNGNKELNHALSRGSHVRLLQLSGLLRLRIDGDIE